MMLNLDLPERRRAPDWITPLAAPSLYHLATNPKLIEIIGPPLRHAYPLVPMRAAIIGGTDPILLTMRQRARSRPDATGLIHSAVCSPARESHG